MIEVYKTANKNVYEKVKTAIARHICSSFEILRTENGKPYIEGNPLFFSISHSKNTAVFALSDSPVGIDLEFADGKKSVKSVLSRFTEREKTQINGDLFKFYENWTVKEAYIKLTGGTLAHDLKRLEYDGGILYCDGKAVDITPNIIKLKNNGICAIFGGITLKLSDFKRFYTRTNERK